MDAGQGGCTEGGAPVLESQSLRAGQVAEELVHEDNVMGMESQQTQPLQATAASVEQGVLGRACDTVQSVLETRVWR